MQPIATAQDFTRTPLNDLLGTKANVRLLRLLANEVSGPIGAPEAAEQVGLTEAGARRALKRLARTGFVEQLGGSRTQTFRIRESDPLTDQIRELFRVEQARHRELLGDLRTVFEALSEIDVAWIERWPDEAKEPLHIGVSAGARELTHLGRETRERIAEVEGRYDVAVELHLFSRSEIEVDELRMKTILAGHAPAVRPSVRSEPTHAARVGRSERASEWIVRMLDRDPSLRRRAERHVDVLLSEDQGSARHDLREWRNILAHYSDQRLKDFLLSDTSRAQRLRQSSPFFAVLTHEERDELLASFESSK